MDPDTVCGRCLVIPNSTSVVTAHFGAGEFVNAPFAPSDPWRLAAWVEQQGTAGAVRFSINDMSNAFIPVATFGGDPVCAGHLYELVTNEARNRGLIGRYT
jgi:hypothetical protein